MKLVQHIKNWNKLRVLKSKLKDLDNVEVYTFTETKYGEPVLIGVIENDESVLTIQLLYAELNNVYRATFLGNYDGSEMIISDIKVLKQRSYSPRNTEPFSKGYGSLLMSRALNEAKDKGIIIVTGDRVSNNPKQLERQLNYYSKFGFSINSENKLRKIL